MVTMAMEWRHAGEPPSEGDFLGQLGRLTGGEQIPSRLWLKGTTDSKGPAV
jgi:hypothetical protein